MSLSPDDWFTRFFVLESGRLHEEQVAEVGVILKICSGFLMKMRSEFEEQFKNIENMSSKRSYKRI